MNVDYKDLLAKYIYREMANQDGEEAVTFTSDEWVALKECIDLAIFTRREGQKN